MRILKRILAFVLMACLLSTSAMAAKSKKSKTPAETAPAETKFSFIGNITWDTSFEEANSILSAKPYKFAASKKVIMPDNQIFLSKGTIDKQTFRWISLGYENNSLQWIMLSSAKNKSSFNTIVKALDSALGKHKSKDFVRISDDKYEAEYPALTWKNDDTQAYLYNIAYEKVDKIEKGKASFMVLIARSDVNVTTFNDRIGLYRVDEEEPELDEDGKPIPKEVVKDTWGTTYDGDEETDLSGMFSTTASYVSYEEKQEEAEKKARAEAIENGEIPEGYVVVANTKASSIAISNDVPTVTASIANRSDSNVKSVTVQFEFVDPERNLVPVFGVHENVSRTYDVDIKPGKAGKVTYAGYGAEGARSVIMYVTSYTLNDGTTLEIEEPDWTCVYKYKR